MKMISRLLLPAITATTHMTIFSYLLSGLAKANFKEPLLLARLLYKAEQQVHPHVMYTKQHQMAGWVLHYGVGVMWSLLTDYLCRKGMQKWIKSPAGYGIICGLISIAVWKQVFKWHPDPPRTNFKAFYAQLVPAHIVFIRRLILERQQLQKDCYLPR